MYLVRAEVTRGATMESWTKNFRHMLPVPRRWTKRLTRQDARVKAVPVRERIKYWNVVPGDQIRVLGEDDKLPREVLSINRFSNRVFVRGVVAPKDTGTKTRSAFNFHYSRCQLFVGNFEFPPKEGIAEPEVLPVYAKRVGTSPPKWNPYFRRWQWDRFAIRTDPPIPYQKNEKIPIPWPVQEKIKALSPGIYDTKAEDVSEVTYKPPVFAMNAPIPRPPSESEYLKSLFNPTREYTFGASPPVEVYLKTELSNPHSRAKKQKRWQAYHMYKKQLFDDFVAAELKALDGRTRREAMAEAAWKWRETIEEEKLAEKKRRWKNRGSVARMLRKKERRARKELKQRQRLTEMVLKEEPNQVIPVV